MRVHVALFLACVLGLAVTTALGVSYSSRHSSHAGFYRVEVEDTVAAPPPTRPRQTVVVVFDGLPYDDAVTMRSFDRIREAGLCRRVDVGPLSVSRPVYAALSTGMEQDRTGARGNDDATPLGAQSIWEIAREHGLTVSAVSELPWWRELFPRGFDDYVMPPRESDYFTQRPDADLQLVHPVYVDEVAHAEGARGSTYAAAVQRADRELGAFLDTIDLSQDLVIATADHGHSLEGGHGGGQDRVTHVRACYGGAGVVHDTEERAMLMTSVGPSLALLLGLPFPSGMRAGDDDLDAIFQIVDPQAMPEGYLDDRRTAITRFREANAAQLRAWWPESEGSWDRFRAHHRSLQVWRAVPCGLAMLVVLSLLARRKHTHRGRVGGVLFVIGCGGGLYLLQIAFRGSFDLSSVSYREGFLAFTITLTIVWSLALVALHHRVRGDLEALSEDWCALSACATLLSLAHPLALGWTVGYPAPTPEVYFFPYFAALALGVMNAMGIVIAGMTWRARSGPQV